MNRIYIKNDLIVAGDLEVEGKTYHYLFKVLRKKTNDEITLFSGDGFDYIATINEINKKSAKLKVVRKVKVDTESNLYTILVQCISKLDKMDLVIQKAVELGVNEIMPIYSEFSNVKMNKEKQQKKQNHWQAIVISACEQSRRAIIPKLHDIGKISDLEDKLKCDGNYKKICLDPYAKQTLSDVKSKEINNKVLFLVGPEGGISKKDNEILKNMNFETIKFGKRILRLETAAISSLAAIQLLWGDLNVKKKEDRLIKETINFPQLLVEPWRAQELVEKESIIQRYRLFKVISLTRICICFFAIGIMIFTENLSLTTFILLSCYIALVISFSYLSKKRSTSIKIYSFLVATLDIFIIGYFLTNSTTNEQVTLLFFSVLLSCMVLEFIPIFIIYLLSSFLLFIDWLHQAYQSVNGIQKIYMLTIRDLSFHVDNLMSSRQGINLIFLLVWLLVMIFIVNNLSRWSFKNEVKAQFRYKQLRHILSFNHSIIEHLKTGVIVLTTNAQIISINKRAIELLGLKGESVLINLKDLSEDLLAEFYNYKNNAPVKQSAYKHNNSSQESSISFTRFSQENNGIIMMSLQSVVEVSSQANEQKLASLGKLTAGIAHEIRNPLSAINSAAELISETPINSHQEKLVGMIASNIKRANKIITNILGLFKNYKSDREMINLNEAISAFVKHFEASNNNVDFKLIFEGLSEDKKDTYILFSPEQFDQVLWNLCFNSLTYGENEALKLEIKIKLRIPDDTNSIFIEISDTGLGIKKEDLPRIFEPFFSGSSKGTGLGLYLVKENL